MPASWRDAATAERPMKVYDVTILGAGAAGLLCAIEAAKRGRRTVVIEHAKKPGGKILISGGGRCNFTNLEAEAGSYVSENPHFCKSALSRFTSQDFIALIQRHGIPFHEKKLGQLFCDRSAKDVLHMLIEEIEKAGAVLQTGIEPREISKSGDGFLLTTSDGDFASRSLVVATGGLSFPKVGASDFGYEVARKFGLNVEAMAPALDGFRGDGPFLQSFRDLAGVSADVLITCHGASFRENVLWTHFGLSGPAALQASLYWRPGDTVVLNLLPDVDAGEWLVAKKREGSRMEVKNLLAGVLTKRLAERLCELALPQATPLHQTADRVLMEFGRRLNGWEFRPQGTMGYDRAEVTRGGVSTEELSSKTMESKKVPGLYFIGEVVDVTGWLGGYNFQWAWSSGWVAGQYV